MERRNGPTVRTTVSSSPAVTSHTRPLRLFLKEGRDEVGGLPLFSPCRRADRPCPDLARHEVGRRLDKHPAIKGSLLGSPDAEAPDNPHVRGTQRSWQFTTVLRLRPRRPHGGPWRLRGQIIAAAAC